MLRRESLQGWDYFTHRQHNLNMKTKVEGKKKKLTYGIAYSSFSQLLHDLLSSDVYCFRAIMSIWTQDHLTGRTQADAHDKLICSHCLLEEICDRSGLVCREGRGARVCPTARRRIFVEDEGNVEIAVQICSPTVRLLVCDSISAREERLLFYIKVPHSWHRMHYLDLYHP